MADTQLIQYFSFGNSFDEVVVICNLLYHKPLGTPNIAITLERKVVRDLSQTLTATRQGL